MSKRYPGEYTLLAGQHEEDGVLYNVGDRIKDSKLDLSKDPEKWKRVVREAPDFTGMSPAELRALADKLEAERGPVTDTGGPYPKPGEIGEVPAETRADMNPGWQPKEEQGAPPQDFDRMTPAQLRRFAAQNEIDLTGAVERDAIIARIKDRR